MNPNEERQFRDIFLREAKKHIATMNNGLLKIEQAPGRIEFIGRLFGAAHTLKGIADAQGYAEMTQLCHALEDVLDAIKKKKLAAAGCVDVLFQCCDFLSASCKSIAEGKEELAMGPIVAQLRSLVFSSKDDVPTNNDVPEPAISEDPAVEKIESIDVKVETLDGLMNIAEELLVSRMKFDGIRQRIASPELTEAVDGLGRLVEELQFRVTQARMVPIGFIFNRFPRMVRDLAKEQHKEVELVLSGREIELDRAVVDEIGESLVHLLRNAVDHGLETTAERKQKGKPVVSKVTVSATRSKEYAVIEVSDDGKGLDLDAIKRTAIARGSLSTEASDQEVMDSIFGGVSTSKKVTKISGRGLGMNIVKKTVEGLGGSVSVHSKPGESTTFALRIPLTMAIMRAIFAKVGDKSYAIPLASVDRMISVKPEDIKGTLDFEAVVLDGEDIPISRLNVLFRAPESHASENILVIVNRGDQKMALMVDDLLTTQEIVIKPLNRVMRDSRFFGGTAIVGSGEPIMVLDIPNLPFSRRSRIKYGDSAPIL